MLHTSFKIVNQLCLNLKKVKWVFSIKRIKFFTTEKKSFKYIQLNQNTSSKERPERNSTGMCEAEHDVRREKETCQRREGLSMDNTRLCILSSSSLNASVSWKKKWYREDNKECNELMSFADSFATRKAFLLGRWFWVGSLSSPL